MTINSDNEMKIANYGIDFRQQYNLSNSEQFMLFHEYEAKLMGERFLVIGNNSINIEYIENFTVTNEQLTIFLPQHNYVFYKSHVKNFDKIPSIIYDYFANKQHGKEIVSKSNNSINNY